MLYIGLFILFGGPDPATMLCRVQVFGFSLCKIKKVPHCEEAGDCQWFFGKAVQKGSPVIGRHTATAGHQRSRESFPSLVKPECEG